MYYNRFTKANPGLIVYMIDQSYSMNDYWSDGSTLAEQASLFINNCIYETIFRSYTPQGIKENVYIVIIGYGGIENSDTAYLIQKGTIRELANSPLRIETVNKKVSDGAGGLVDVEFDMPIWIEPKAVCGTPMAKAFDMAYQIIDGWVTKKQNRQTSPESQTGQPTLDSVPIVINITDGMPTDSIDDVKANANKIQSIACPDGNPPIFNVLLEPNGGNEIMFASEKPNADEATELMYEISSELPEAFVKDAKKAGFNVKSGDKTFLSNCKTVEKFMEFLYLSKQIMNDPFF